MALRWLARLGFFLFQCVLFLLFSIVLIQLGVAGWLFPDWQSPLNWNPSVILDRKSLTHTFLFLFLSGALSYFFTGILLRGRFFPRRRSAKGSSFKSSKSSGVERSKSKKADGPIQPEEYS